MDTVFMKKSILMSLMACCLVSCDTKVYDFNISSINEELILNKYKIVEFKSTKLVKGHNEMWNGDGFSLKILDESKNRFLNVELFTKGKRVNVKPKDNSLKTIILKGFK